MCIAIYKPADKEISDDVLKICYTNNKDGCGFAYINKDHKGIKRIKIKKSMDFDVFLKQYKRAIEVNPESPFLIHFRIGTHGVRTNYNCHPFRIDDETVFIHNGVISGVGTDEKKSDTQLFNDVVLKRLPKGLLTHPTIKFLIEDFIGYSKLITLDINGSVNIYNEKKGEWVDGIWFSNNGYKEKPVYVPPTRADNGRFVSQKPWYQQAVITSSALRAEIQKRADQEQKTRINHDNILDLIPCDGCNTVGALEDFTPFYMYGQCEAYCKFCKQPHGASFMSNVREVSQECYEDWCDSDPKDEYKNTCYTGMDWKNPWGTEILDKTVNSGYTEEDYFQNPSYPLLGSW